MQTAELSRHQDDGDGKMESGPLREQSGIRARSYQLEMLEMSLKQNVIVTMDTGSGKTHIAILRIMAELDRSPPQKLIWFLAPTVSLCIQQHKVILKYLPAVQIRLLIGADNVDRWGEQRIWEAVLRDVRLVVSTHAVLKDALSHGFVHMKRLSLLVFDEAHHCARGHPANAIMRDFYHPLKQQDGLLAVPHILGLTASPVVRSKPADLQMIEQNLNSICTTPQLYRQELLQCVHQPLLKNVVYSSQLSANPFGEEASVFRKLLSIVTEIEILKDPYVLKLKADSNNPTSQRRLKDMLLTRKTYCNDQLNRLCTKARHIYEELGAWPADYFIIASINRFKESVRIRDEVLLGWDDAEKDYLANLLTPVESLALCHDFGSVDLSRLSAKAEQFIDLLVEEDNAEFSGLVFVKQRATVVMLCHLLSVHPRTRDTFECGSFVGTSTSGSRKTNLGELLEPKAQKDTLDDFRKGSKNLIVATSVLEEGIDIFSCHLVICFNRPENLKSFVQRRGRARKEKSTFVVMSAMDDVAKGVSEWQALEEEMVRMYQDDMRELAQIAETENIEEDCDRQLRVESTGAVITLDSAMAHLYHFCATLPQETYVDLRPSFAFEKDAETGLISATVSLPSCVDISVRQVSGADRWLTERAAQKDAALEAYAALRSIGLINDHLLPLWAYEQDGLRPVEEVSSLLTVSEQYNPWVDVAQSWISTPSIFEKTLMIEEVGGQRLRMRLYLPTQVSLTLSGTLYWNEHTSFTLNERREYTAKVNSPDNCQILQDVTYLLLKSVHSGRMNSERRDFPALFGPDMELQELQAWLTMYSGIRPAVAAINEVSRDDIGLVRFGQARYVLRQWVEVEDGADVKSSGALRRRAEDRKRPYAEVNGTLRRRVEDEEGPHAERNDTRKHALEVIPLLKRRDFLHHENIGKEVQKPANQEQSSKKKGQILCPESCTIDNLPFRYAQFALFIPSIMHLLEILLIAQRVITEIIPSAGIQDWSPVVTAICASSAREASNYQKLELLGDSVLKFLVSVQLFASHPRWHEGYLSAGKDCIVSNSRLTRAACEAQLDQVIVTKAFSGRKWSPSDLLIQSSGATRTISSKVLADVVEALIGAAFVDGGIKKAMKCACVFLSELHGVSAGMGFPSAINRNLESECTPEMSEVEDMVGHVFDNKAVLKEALTHPSYERDSITASYQRLEFLGDAILDFLVVTALHEDCPRFSHYDLHIAKTVLVNANFLAFLCLEFSTLQHGVVVEQRANKSFFTTSTTQPVQLWRYMRHHHPEILLAQKVCVDRHAQLRAAIKSSLETGRSYPWIELTQLEAPKFLSDIIESLIGAIFVDSKGDMSQCRRFIDRIGILPYLRRIVTTEKSKEIDLLHPKERLGLLAIDRTVDYRIVVENNSGMYWCSVKVGGVEIVRVPRGSSRIEAETRAARRACEILSSS